jgi:hypothetical protein
MDTAPAKSDKCPLCAGDMLAVRYYGADGEPTGGYGVCANCGPRSVSELSSDDGLRRQLLERKAS